MMKMKHLFTGLFCLFAFCTQAEQTIIVSPKGKDTNTGTLKKPLQTLQKAISIAEKSREAELRIYLREGTYYLPASLQITSDMFKDKSLLISGYEDEKVTLSGGAKLTPEWEKVPGTSLWKAKVAETGFDQLFINHQKRILARTPNYTEGVILNGYSSDVLSPERVQRWKNPKGGFIHALHSGEWGDMHYVITGKKGDQVTYEGGFQNNRPSGMHSKYRFVENIFEELDAPGEWFLDKEQSTLYYYPCEGENIQKAQVEVALIPSLIEIRGTEKKAIKDITIHNLRFIQTTRTFMGTYEPLMRSDWRIYRGAAVFMEFAEQCTVSDCEFTDLGGNALFISKYAQGCTISGNHIHHIGASAICIVGDTTAVRSPSFEYGQFVPYEQLDQTPGPNNNLYPRQCTVEDNLIHHIGQVEKQSAAVEIQLAAQINVRHNTMYQMPRAAINVGDGAFGGHVIEFNDAFKTVLETSDHGAFNSWGRDRFWHPSYGTMEKLTAEHPELILLDALYTTIIRNNRFRCDFGWDIDLDDGSTNYHIYNNLCLKGGIKLREGFYRTVENNILVNGSLHPHVWFKQSGDVIQRNVFMRAYQPIQLHGWGKTVDYNFFNTPENLAFAQKNGVDPHGTSGKLSFRDAAKGDFTIEEGCPAFNIGFENFPMDQFGVTSPALKALAEQPEMPQIILADASDLNKEYEWLDGKVRAVNGLGDRSAFGLPDEKGVILLTITKGGILEAAKLQPKDVIRSVNGTPVATINDLFVITDGERWRKVYRVEIFRDQKLINATIQLNK